MPRFIAFLRAINVGGRNVSMTVLRGHFESLGFRNVETFIASGNVLFKSPTRNLAGLERQIENCLRQSLGYEVATFIRTDLELAAIARSHPFNQAQVRNAGALVVGLLAAPLSGEGQRFLATFNSGMDRFHVNGRELYWWSRGRQSESAFSAAVLERAIKARVTFRGMRTIERLVTKSQGG